MCRLSPATRFLDFFPPPSKAGRCPYHYMTERRRDDLPLEKRPERARASFSLPHLCLISPRARVPSSICHSPGPSLYKVRVPRGALDPASRSSTSTRFRYPSPRPVPTLRPSRAMKFALLSLAFAAILGGVTAQTLDSCITGCLSSSEKASGCSSYV